MAILIIGSAANLIVALAAEVPLVFAVVYGAVLVAIFLNRAWFDAMRAWRVRRG